MNDNTSDEGRITGFLGKDVVALVAIIVAAIIIVRVLIRTVTGQ